MAWDLHRMQDKTDSDLVLKWPGSQGPSRLLGVRGERGEQGAGRRESRESLSAACLSFVLVLLQQ